MNVTLPDGRVIKNVPEGTTKAQLVQKLKANGVDVPDAWVKQATQDELRNPVTGMRGALEATANVATGAAAFPLQLGAGLAGAVLPGPPGQGQDYMNKVGDAFVYQPKTLAGQAIADTAHAPGEWLGNKAQQAGKAVADVAGAGAGAVTEATIETAPALLGIGGRAARPSVTKYIGERKQAYDAKASRDSVKAQTWEAAKQEGYVVPPSAVEGSFLTNRLESAGGKAAIGQEATLRNQEVTDKIARREAGLPKNAPIDADTLEAARERISAPYREVEALPGLPAQRFTTQLNPMRNPYPLIGETPPTPKQLVHDWKSVNNKATELWKDYQRNAKVETLDAYKSALKEKDAIETSIEEAAVAAGRPDLVPALRDARVKIAKNYTVERALNFGDGHVDARTIGRLLDKAPRRFTGGLETIGKFSEAFYPYTREASKVPTPGVSKSEALASVTLGVVGHAASGGAGTLAAAIPLLSHPARSLALSRLMQPSTGLKPYSPGLGLRATLNATDQGITDPAALILMSEEKRKGLGL